MKTVMQFHGHRSDLFSMHPFHALFSLVASTVLILLVTLWMLLLMR